MNGGEYFTNFYCLIMCYFGILWSIFMETYIATVRCLYVQNCLQSLILQEKWEGNRNTLKEFQ